MKNIVLIFLCLLIFTSCQRTYVAMGVSYDRGTVAQDNPFSGGQTKDKGRGVIVEVGNEFSKNNVVSFNTGFLGYTDNYDGDLSSYWSFEYSRYLSKDGFGLFAGVGIGKNGRYNGGFILPFRVGAKVDIPFGEKFGMRLMVLNRYQKYFDGQGYNNGVTLMAGFKF